MLLSSDFRTLRLAEVSGNESSPVRIDLTEYKSKMQLEMESILDWMAEKKERLSQFTLTDALFNEIKEGLAEYPRLEVLLRGVRSQDEGVIKEEISNLWEWLINSGGGRDRYTEVRKAVTTLMDYSESLEGVEERYSEGQAKGQLQQIIKQTQENMKKIEALVHEAIERIPTWHGYPIVIIAEPSSSDMNRDRYRFEPSENVTVSLEVGSYPPSFSLFTNEDGSVVIDDVLEGGDTDFFTDMDSQTDYFNLVNEIKNPNSTQKTKNLILYTARPSSDRKLFEQAKTLPVNVFLTNKFDHALGLASDLAGSEGMRDVWKVRMDSRYLTQTLEGPVNYYQVTVPDAPVKSLDLVHAE